MAASLPRRIFKETRAPRRLRDVSARPPGDVSTSSSRSLGGSGAQQCQVAHASVLGLACPPPEISLDAAAICSSASCVSFDTKMFATAADHIRLRRFNVDCEEDVKRVSAEDLLAWLDAMSEHCGVSVKGALKLAATGKERVHEYAVESLITAVRIADHLSSDDNTKKVLELSGQYLGLPVDWCEDAAAVPSSTTVRRMRFRLDAVFTALIRERLKLLLDDGIEFVIVLIFDASPRSGREWLFGEMFVVRDDRLQQFDDAMWRLADMRKRAASGLEEFDSDLAQQLAKQMHESVWHIVLTTACLGARAADLAQKFSSSIHILRLISDGWRMCHQLTGRSFCLCSDLGVECDLPRVEFDAHRMFPHWAPRVVDDEGDCMMPLLNAALGFRGALAAPGTEHVIHNIEKSMTDKMTHFKHWFKLAKHLGRFCRGRFYVDRFAQVCVPACPENLWFTQHLYAFDKMPYEKRFGTLVVFILAITPLRAGLQRWYDACRFEGKDHGDEDDESWCDMAFVTEAITKHAWWSRAWSLVAAKFACVDRCLTGSR